MRTTSFWQRLSAPVRNFGLADGALFLMHRTLQALTGGRARIVAYGLYAQPIGAGAYAGMRDDPKTRVIQAAQSDSVGASFPRSVQVIAKRYAAGARCHVVLVGDEFAGYIWLSRRTHDEDEVRARYRLLEPDLSVWDFDVYVEPAWRFGRTLARLWKAVDEQLDGEGVRWSFSRISRFNVASTSTHVRLGARRVACLTFLSFGPVQLSFASLAPYLHISWRESGRPEYALAPPP